MTRMRNRTHRWPSATLAAAITLLNWGCSAASPVAEPVPQPPTSTAPTPSPPGAPLPPAPLVGLPPGQQPTAQPPVRHESREDLKVLNVSVNGDPARIVYPTPTLAPHQQYPVLIFFHGSGMDQTQLTDRTRLADKAAQEGWLAASAMLTGRAHWGDPGALRAAGNLIQVLVSQHQVDPRRIYLVGFSMGGGTALLAAANPLGLPYRAAAVVSTQGFTDLLAMTRAEAGGGAYARPIAEAYGGELDATEAEAHSPLAQAEKLRGIPIYLEHGQADTAVPASHSQRLAEKLASLQMPPVLQLYPGKGHGEETIDEDAIIAFLRGKTAP